MPTQHDRPATRRFVRLLPTLLLVLAGCAGGASKYVSKPLTNLFSVVPSALITNTNGKVQFKAISNAGASAAVKWSIVRGENDDSIGQGSVDTRGSYTPPSSLTRDAVSVEVKAELRSDPTQSATEVIRIVPGFLQPLTPENATLAPDATLQITAQLAEVGGGSVDWQLATAPAEGKRLGSEYGTLSQRGCQYAQRTYTLCSVTYEAPTNLPAPRTDLYVVATLSSSGSAANNRQALHILLGRAGISSTPLTNQAAQTSLVQLGSSGGNNNDADTTEDYTGNSYINDCCGGTLGSLLRDETGTQYILSNNHVLAESDQAKVGDNIVQPGLIDRNCDQNAGRSVAALRYVVPLAASQTNVDAALAEVNASTVDPSGAILQLGAAGSGTNGGLSSAPPAGGEGENISPSTLGQQSGPWMVAKSGRTTGLTCSAIDAISLNIVIDYYKDCAETQPYLRKTFSNQVGIGGDGFSDSGDSGALIVDSKNAQPLALYFAGGTDDHGDGFSVASPIQEVLAELGTGAKHQFSVVGAQEHPVACLKYDAATASPLTPSEAQRKRAEGVIRKTAAGLINPATGILDIVPAISTDAPGEAALLVYIDREKEQVSVPQTIAGLRTVVVATNPTAWNSGLAPQSQPAWRGLHLPENVLTSAIEVQQTYSKRLMSDPAIFGVGVSESRDHPGEAALLVLVDMSRTPKALPPVIGGLRTRYVRMHRFHVTRSKYAAGSHPSTCAAATTPGTSDLRHEESPATGFDFHPDVISSAELPWQH